MADRRTADARLRRILHVLPAAARDGGAPLDELAADLDVEPATVLRDLEEVTARSLYLPPGPADDLQIQLTPERVRVWTKGDFARPVKLLTREALALGLGLRALAASAGAAGEEDGDGRERTRALRRRLERHLAMTDTEELQPRFEPAADTAPGDPDGSSSPGFDVPGAVFDAARRRSPCRIRYLKPGAPEPEDRTVHPWSLVRAEGRWYVLGADGSLVVRHRVADPRWIVGHVLQYGPDAEVLEPEGVRERVRERVEGLIG